MGIIKDPDNFFRLVIYHLFLKIAFGRASEAKSEGRGFKSLFKQIFALTLKLLIDYILSILAYVWLRLTSLLSIYFRASQESLAIKVVCMMIKCKNDRLYEII